MQIFGLNQNQQVTIPLPIPIGLGGTGSSEQNFIDLNSDQTITAPKNFTDLKIGEHLPFKFNDSHSFGSSFNNLENGVFSGDSSSVDGVLKGWHVITSTNSRGAGYGVQLALSDTDANGIAMRQKGSGAWQPWKRILHDGIFDPISHTQVFTGGARAISETPGWMAQAVSPESTGIEIKGSGGGAAYFSFHRPSAFANFLGLDVDNILKYGGWSQALGRVWHEGYGSPVWQAPSDKRLKNSIKPISTANALDLISQFNPVQFRYTAEVRKTGMFGDLKLRYQPHYGFLAQEIPIDNLRLVKDGGEMGINYIEIIPFLVGAIQELQKQIENLKINH